MWPTPGHFPRICVDAPGFDRAAFHKDFNAAIISFLRRHLPGNKAKALAKKALEAIKKGRHLRRPRVYLVLLYMSGAVFG